MLNKLKKFFKLFEPDSFEDNAYFWLVNQVGHIALSFTLCHIFNIWIPFLIFWVVWEIRHYIISKNLKDLIEDLTFELSGIFIFIYGDIPLYISISILLMLLYKRL